MTQKVDEKDTPVRVPQGWGEGGRAALASGEAPSRPRTVILGVAASDAHVVANRLIELCLRRQGFEVVNLGVCTPIAAFCETFERYPHTEAVLIGSLNGHVYDDLRELPHARARGLLNVPVVLGGNLSVGSRKRDSDLARLCDLGVDAILDGIDDIVPFLNGRLVGSPA